jgi:hypothetical protein
MGKVKFFKFFKIFLISFCFVSLLFCNENDTKKRSSKKDKKKSCDIKKGGHDTAYHDIVKYSYQRPLIKYKVFKNNKLIKNSIKKIDLDEDIFYRKHLLGMKKDQIKDVLLKKNKILRIKVLKTNTKYVDSRKQLSGRKAKKILSALKYTL